MTEVTGSKEQKITELLELSQIDQEPRYFIEESIPTCRYCRQKGHMFRDCKQKETLCTLCRENHDPRRCPLSEICFQCFRRGHVKNECPEYGKAKYCKYCDMRGHSTMDCTKVWRQYLTIKPKPVKSFVVCCFYCGSTEHFGDFCNKRDRSYHPPSAFDFDNEEILDMKDLVEKANKKRNTGNNRVGVNSFKFGSDKKQFGGDMSKKHYSSGKRLSFGSSISMITKNPSQSPASKKKRRQTFN